MTTIVLCASFGSGSEEAVVEDAGADADGVVDDVLVGEGEARAIDVPSVQFAMHPSNTEQLSCISS
jgi:hypothetical protein